MANTETNNPTGQVPPSVTGRDAGAAGLNTLADQLEAQRIPRGPLTKPNEILFDIESPHKDIKYAGAGSKTGAGQGWNRYQALSGNQSQYTGWKIHVSASTVQAQEALVALAIKHGLGEFKFGDIDKFQEKGFHQAGKTAVFYHTELGVDGKPIDWAKFVQEADNIVNKLGGPGQPVLNDKAVKGSKAVFYRNDHGVVGDFDHTGEPRYVANKDLEAYAKQKGLPLDRLYNLGDRPDPFKEIEVKSRGVVVPPAVATTPATPESLKASIKSATYTDRTGKTGPHPAAASLPDALDLNKVSAELNKRGVTNIKFLDSGTSKIVLEGLGPDGKPVAIQISDTGGKIPTRPSSPMTLESKGAFVVSDITFEISERVQTTKTNPKLIEPKQLLPIIEELHARGYSWTDANTNNVGITEDGRIVILDVDDVKPFDPGDPTQKLAADQVLENAKKQVATQQAEYDSVKPNAAVNDPEKVGAKQVITDEMIAKEKANAIKYAQEENARRAELSKKLGIPQNSPESEALAKKRGIKIDPIPEGISDEQARARITHRINNPDAFADDGRPTSKATPADEILSEREQRNNRAKLAADKQARLQAKTVAAAEPVVPVMPVRSDPTPTLADINLDEGKPAPKPISATPDDIADRVAWDKVEDGKGKPTTTAVSADAGTPAPSNPNARTAASTRASVANGGGGAVGIIFGAKQLSDAIETGDTFNAGLATANLGTSAAIVGAEVQAARAGLAGAEGLAAGGASTGSKVLGAAGKYAGRAAIPLAIVSIGYDAYKEEGTGEDDKMAYKAARVGVGATALAIGIGAAAIVGSIFTGGASLALLPVAAGVVAGGGAAVAGNYAVDKHKEGRIKDKQDAAAAEAEKENAVKREKFKEAIDRLDKNKDGKVDMADLDPKGKGGISLENYANKDGVFDRKQLEEMKKDIAAISVIADQTKDEGFVKLRDEMTKMSADADVELTKIEKAATLARLDKNKDGKIDIADFSKDGAVSIDKSRYTTAAKFDEKSTEALRKDVKLLEAAAKENAELNPALEKMKALAATAEMDVASVLLDKDKNGSINKQDFVIRSVVNGQEEINWEKYANSDKKIDFTSLAAMKKDLAALELVANGNPEMASVRDLMKKTVAENEKFLLENEPKRLDKNNDGKLDASDFGADSKGNITRESYNGGKPLSPEALEKLRRDVDTLDALSENNSQYVKIRDSLKAIYVAETTQAGKQGQVEFDFPPDQTVNAIANGQVTPAGAAQAGSVVSPDATSAGVAGTVVSATVAGTGDMQPNRFAAQAATTTAAQSVPGTTVGSVASGRA
jgi:Ca2+-binding EF-hand superfamily protein